MNAKTLLAAILVGASLSAQADIHWGGDWAYDYLTSTVVRSGESVVVTNGVQILGYKGESTSVSIPSKMDHWTVRRVGEFGLKNQNFVHVTIPESIEMLKPNAFTHCEQLETVSIVGNNLTNIEAAAFSYCKKLKSINLPDSIWVLGDYAFEECALETVVMPPNVSKTSRGLFQKCTHLTSVDLNNVKVIGSHTFSRCYALPETGIDVSGVTEIGEGAFFECTSFKTFKFPDCIKQIPDSVLSGCTALESVEFADDITTIGAGAFQNCKSLASIKIPPTLTVICDKAFTWAKEPIDVYITDLAKWCAIDFGDNPLINGHLYLNGQLVTDLVIPDGVVQINRSAFSGVQDLVSITLPEGLLRFEDPSYSLGAFEHCHYVTNVVIPSSLEYCSHGTFYQLGSWSGASVTVRIRDLERYCNICFVDTSSTPFYQDFEGNRLILNGEEIRDLVIPESVSSVSNYVFRNARRLTSVTFEGEMDRIGVQAFETCDCMTSVTFRASVDTIGGSAFGGARRMQTVNIPDDDTWCHIGFDNNASNPLYTNDKISELRVNGELVTDIDVTGGVGQYAFNYYRWLKSARISGEGSIGQSAFSHCSALQSVEIGDGVRSIGQNAFDSCGSLVYLPIASTVTDFGGTVFQNDQALRRVSIPPSVSRLASTFYSNFGFPSAYTKITDLTLDEGYTVVSSNCLDGCAALCSVTLPKTLVEVEEGAFAYERCPALRTVYVPAGCGVDLLKSVQGALASRPDVDLVLCADSDLPVPLPDATEEQIAGALGAFADTKIVEKIRTWAEYMDFRQWMMTVKGADGEFLGSDGVRSSPYAWLSYALASETLLARPIVEDDLRVTAFAQNAAAKSMTFDLAAAISGVRAGASAKPAYLAEIFGVKGAERLEPAQFGEDGLATTFRSPVQGELMLSTALNERAESFFFKMKVRP